MASSKLAGNRIREVRLSRGLTMEQLGEKVGAHYTTIAKMERSLRAISVDWLVKLAAALDVGPADLLSSGAIPPVIRMVPVIGQIQAGNWSEAIAHANEFIPVPGGGANIFALRARGESMNLIIAENDYAVIDPDQRELLDGGIYAVMNGEGETTLKQFRTDPLRLEPRSTDPAFKPIPIGGQPFTVIGRAVQMMRNL